MTGQVLFNMLADGTRRRILALLAAEGELCVCELCAALGETQPKVSRHLGTLKEAALVQTRRSGTWMFYRLPGDLPHWCDAVLTALTLGGEPALADDRRRLLAFSGRPARCAELA